MVVLCVPFALAAGMTQRDALGCQLADDQRKVGDRRDDDAEGDLRRMGREKRNSGDPRLEIAGERGSTESTGKHANQGDADLHGAEEAFGVFQQLQRLPRAAGAFLSKLLEPPLASGNQRDLRHGEYTVANEEDENGDDFEHDGVTVPVATGRFAGPR